MNIKELAVDVRDLQLLPAEGFLAEVEVALGKKQCNVVATCIGTKCGATKGCQGLLTVTL